MRFFLMTVFVLCAGFAGAQTPEKQPVARPQVGGQPFTGAASVPSAGAASVPSGATSLPALSRESGEALLDKISNLYNGLDTLQGRFVQVGPDGSRAMGQFYLVKPGKIRFAYALPQRMDVIADGRSVLVHDKIANTRDIYLIQQTPMKYLLSKRVDLKRDARTLKALETDALIGVTLSDKGLGTAGELTLYFDKETLTLKQWDVVDAQGLQTSVSIQEVAVNQDISPQLFKIDYEGLRQQQSGR